MRHTQAFLFMVALSTLAVACSGPKDAASATGGSARVSVDGASYEVSDVSIVFEPGEDAWFRIEGEPAVGRDEDCVPGLSGGLGLYGDLPSSVTKPADLAGQRLRVDFTGDGDEANFCFVGMGGLAGAEDAWVTIDSVDADRVTVTMTGTFRIFDQNGDGPVTTARATGTAIVRSES